MELFGYDIYEMGLQYAKDNQFLGGGMALGIMTAILYQLRALLNKFRLLVTRLFSTQITCNSTGGSEYDKLDYWVYDNFKTINSVDFNSKNEYAIGQCNTIQYKYFCPIHISKSLQDKENVASAVFQYNIRIYGFKKQREKIIKEIKGTDVKRHIPAIYNNGCFHEYLETAQPPISKDTEDVIADYKFFLQNKPLYERLGLKYHRNYLLYGKPGTGKTSVIRYLAKKYNKSIRSITIDDNTTNYELVDHFSFREDTIYVIEDLDRVNFHAKEKEWSSQTLMNILDGVLTIENTVIFATANEREKIEPALIRDGRFDFFGEIGLPSNEEIDVYVEKNDIPLKPEELYGLNLSQIQKKIKQVLKGFKDEDSRPN